ncbi:MAG: GTPase Era [Schleiferiaceae bacterium]|nr:GTPase Era [Schleiferiaceae bacterium]
MDQQTHKAGFVNIIGNPNVGKSTLMNALLGQKLSIITPKAQTTRHRIFGILNDPQYQIVFSDTPGVIKPAYAMQSQMMDYVGGAFEDADVFLYVVEIGERALKDEKLFNKLQNTKIPVIILLNKVDLATQEKLESESQFWQQTFPNAEVIPVSALKNFQLDHLVERLVYLLPESPAYFDKEAITDRHERYFVSEIIREKILLRYQKEIPYAVEVVVEEFFEEDPKITRIRAIIYVERQSQKGIIIGHKGAAIKHVGIDARKDIEAFLDKHVHLELFVKVQKDWRSDTQKLKRFGY